MASNILEVTVEARGMEWRKSSHCYGEELCCGRAQNTSGQREQREWTSIHPAALERLADHQDWIRDGLINGSLGGNRLLVRSLAFRSCYTCLSN